MKAKGEVGQGEDGEGFNEDGRHGFFSRQMRVELVAVSMSARQHQRFGAAEEGPKSEDKGGSDRANIKKHHGFQKAMHVIFFLIRERRGRDRLMLDRITDSLRRAKFA